MTHQRSGQDGRDARAETAAYYDLAPDFPRDIPFYLEQVTNPAVSVLELGCGTGRVTSALRVPS